MRPILTVAEITQVIKNLIEGNQVLSNVYIRGEISNFKHHSSGHMYFTLKDRQSQVACVMFRNKNLALSFLPENGMEIVAAGYIGVYARSGNYQLYVEGMELDGLGALHIAFEKLKSKLKSEGLFDVNKKRPLPYLPQKVGIVTSITGAALRDLLTVITRRFINVDIIIAPVLVQGPNAPPTLCSAISDLNKIPDLDLIIIGRGGGSIEELWAFNDEEVARRIFHSSVPIISAVGHETDFTIADFVADKRAPTPSAAGEMAVPEKTALQQQLMGIKFQLVKAMRSYLSLKREQIKYLNKSPVYIHPEDLTSGYRLTLDQWADRLQNAMLRLYENHRMHLKNEMSRLNALSPLGVMERGYSIATRAKDHQVIRKTSDVSVHDKIRLVLTDGSLYCKVTEIEGG